MKSKYEQKTQKFIEEVEAKGGKPIYTLSPLEARKVLEDLQAKGEKLPVKIEDKEWTVGKTKVSVRIIRPENSTDVLPVILYYHGGGWILGSKNTHDRLVREIAVGTKAAVVFVNYTPSPEAKYPVPLEEGYAALIYVAEHARELNVDAARIAIIGDSAGGNMAAAVTLLAKERKGPKIVQQILFYPVTDSDLNTESYKEFAEGPWLTKAAMEWFWNAYAPDASSRNDHLVSPLRSTIEQLKGLPKALVITDENDVLRSEGEAYAHKLMEAGVEVEAVRYLGTIHDFVMLSPLANTPATRSAIALAIATLNKAFKKETETLGIREKLSTEEFARR
ncbi:MAG: alpha/beta hydrolase [Parachlamydiales bacterium]|jgi:acetyl esterase